MCDVRSERASNGCWTWCNFVWPVRECVRAVQTDEAWSICPSSQPSVHLLVSCVVVWMACVHVRPTSVVCLGVVHTAGVTYAQRTGGRTHTTLTRPLSRLRLRHTYITAPRPSLHTRSQLLLQPPNRASRSTITSCRLQSRHRRLLTRTSRQLTDALRLPSRAVLSIHSFRAR